jgi:hypothetical protein
MCDQKTARCQKIQGVGYFPVFNMEVDSIHLFTANGLVVHNCLDAAADLNAMYIYDYTPQKEKKKERLPGTFSPVEEVPDELTFYDEINIAAF